MIRPIMEIMGGSDPRFPRGVDRLRCAGLLLGIVCSAAAQSPIREVAAQPRAEGFASEPRVLEVLAGLEGRRRKSPQRVATELAALGRSAVPLIVEEYWRVRSFVSSTKDPGPTRDRELKERRRLALELALQKLPLGIIHKHLLEVCGEGRALQQRLAVLRTLEIFGQATSIPVIRAVVKPLPPQLAKAPPVGPLFRSSLAAIMRRDRRAFAAIDELFRKLSPGLQDLAVQAVRDQRSARALRLLTGLLSGRDPRLDVSILQAMKEMPRMALQSMPSQHREKLRRRLRHRRWNVRLATAELLLVMKDIDSFPDVVELLDSDMARVRRRASIGLQAATGQRILAESRRWRNWFEDEMEWIETQGDRLVDEVASGKTARALAALRKLSEHQFVAPVLARDLREVLQEAEPELKSAAFNVLAAMGAGWIIELCLETLDSEDLTEKKSAHAALLRLTGEKIPPSRRAWSEQLEVWKGR